ncbi:hypothetical protein [Streptomyces griseoluteus]|uniref:hypothetical protein n=1 Tax=Streptomyces griseoluteus TaxID=29306 RepID=UPI0036FE2AFF
MSHVDMLSLGGEIYSDLPVARNLDGRLEIFAIGNDRGIYHRWHGGSDNGWNDGGWSIEPLGGICGDLSVARNADGRLEVFVIGNDNGVYHRWQTAPSGHWNTGGWSENPLGGAVSNIEVASNKDGRLEIFALGSDVSVYHRWQIAPSNGWNTDGWQPLGGGGLEIVGHVQVGRDEAGCLELFLRTRTGIYHRWQTSPNNGWNPFGWQPLGQPGQVGNIPGDVTVGQNRDGRLHIFVVHSDLVAYHRWQEAGSWNSSGWQPVNPRGPMTGNVTAARNSDGLLEIFTRGRNTNWLYRMIQSTPNAPTFTSGIDLDGWNPWPGPAGSGHLLQCSTDATAIQNALGKVEVFVRDKDKSAYRLLSAH